MNARTYIDRLFEAPTLVPTGYRRSMRGWWLDPTGEMIPLIDINHQAAACQILGVPCPEDPNKQFDGEDELQRQGYRRVVVLPDTSTMYVHGGPINRAQQRVLKDFAIEHGLELRVTSMSVYSPYHQDTVVESIDRLFEDFDYDAAADWLDRVQHQQRQMWEEFKANPSITHISWPRVRAARLKKIWLDFGRSKVVRDAKGMQQIADQVMTLIARFYGSTQMSGHTDDGWGLDDVLRGIYDGDENEPTEEEKNRFLDTLEDEKGSYLLSDSAFRWLEPLYQEIFRASTPEEQLYAVDKVLNIVHRRSDLAGIFVEGGQTTLNQIASQGGYETPPEQQAQDFRRKEGW